MQKIAAFIAIVLLQGVFTQDPCGSITDEYQQVLCKSFVFYEAQRSGYLSNLRIDWRWDSATDDGSDNGVDLEGGYYDAGDHVKFMFPQAYTLTALSWGLILYQSGFDTAGQTEYAREAIRWGTDFLLKCYVSDNQVFAQVGDGHADHAFWGRPEDMTMERPSFFLSTTGPGSEIGGEYAAALAAASIVFTGVDDAYAAECLSAARGLFNFGNTYRGTYVDTITNAGDFYNSFNGYVDELAWAALWLYKATGEQTYLDQGLALVDEGGIQWYAEGMGWDSKNPGIWALLAELDPAGQYNGLLAEYAYRMVNEFTKTPGGVLYFDQWGSLRNAANAAFIVLRAGTLSGYDTGNTDTNIQFARGQLDYMLGSNPLGRSFVVGYGTNPPTQPHHRSSSCPDMPDECNDSHQTIDAPNPQTLYGALVGGVDENDGYDDVRTDYIQNEVALDYNALFTGLVAGIIQYG